MSNDWKAILQDARRALIALGVGLVLACILLFGSDYARQRVAQTRQQADAEFAAQEEIRAQKERDLSDIDKNLPEFRQLISNGLMGSAEREGWIEQLTATHRQLGLPNTLNYILQAPRPYQAGNPTVNDLNPPPDNTGAGLLTAGNGILTHDLLIELSAIHEGDVLNLIDHYRRQVKGLFRIQECEFSQPGETGLSARCVLRFFTYNEQSPG